MLCEGCGACQLVCPKKAIKLVKVYNGKIWEADTRYGFPLFSGQLKVGATGSGKIFSLIKEKAEERALKTADHFRIPYGIVINKFDLNIDFSKKIERFAKNKGIDILGRIPYNKKIVEALVELKPAIEYDKTLEPIFNEILSNILKKLEEI
ncbi:MAG: hypothetical protein PWQ87_106 [Candidatus Woesearchaeota archaeon]|nr:hypothetical protein [Candidatus Woesearchaeota archaeon]